MDHRAQIYHSFFEVEPARNTVIVMQRCGVRGATTFAFPGFLFLLCTLAGAAAIDASDCNIYTDCASCTEFRQCAWELETGACAVMSKEARNNVVVWEDTCPTVAPKDKTDDFLANWMKNLMVLDEFRSATLLDLALAGTHDTLTYDLSLEVSDGGIDDHDRLAKILHNHDKIIPNAGADFVRQQAQTQALTVTQQLDNGIRFLDLRMMYEYSARKDKKDWYSLHLLQSNKPMLSYLTEIRDWLVAHPSEVVVLWLSKHGSVCAKGEDQYPNTPIEVKQAYWETISDLFGNLKVDSRRTRLNETSIANMVTSNERAVFYLSDYAEFSANSPYAFDACLIQNELGPSVDEEEKAVQWEQNLFIGVHLTKVKLREKQGFLLMSMATGVPAQQVVGAAALRFTDNQAVDKLATQTCTDSFHIPGMTRWCPGTLLDVAQLENYYKQLTLDQCYTNLGMGWSFPNAIYLNGLMYGGQIRIGTDLPWVHSEDAHGSAGFAYVDTIIASNVYAACDPDTHHGDLSEVCEQMTSVVKRRMAMAPVTVWTDEAMGRLENWPDIARGLD